MPYKSLQQLRDEHRVHHGNAMRLLEEAARLFGLMKKTPLLSEDHQELHKLWLETDAEARSEIKKSVDLTNQFIQELERLNNRNSN